MRTFFVGLALGLGIGFLLVPRHNDEHDQLIRERTRELQRSLPQHHERALQSAAIQERDRFTVPRRPQYQSRAGAVRVGIHPVALLNMATKKELVSAGIEPALVAKIIAGRPYLSLQDARDRSTISVDTLASLERAAAAHEPIPLQPLA